MRRHGDQTDPCPKCSGARTWVLRRDRRWRRACAACRRTQNGTYYAANQEAILEQTRRAYRAARAPEPPRFTIEDGKLVEEVPRSPF